MKSIRSSVLPLLASLIACGSPLSLSAQIISTTVASTTTGETFDLESNGPTDWVQFGVSGSSTGFNLSNEKSGGSVGGLDTIGAVNQGNDPYAGSTETTQQIEVSYTNGTNPATATTSSVGNVGILTGFAGGNPSPDGTTLSFTINFNQAISSGTVELGGDTFGVDTAALSAALSNGNTTITNTGTAFANEQDDIFTVNLSNITAGSSLTLSWDLVAGDPNVYGGAYDDLGLSGVALNLTPAMTPEPSTYAMLLVGFASLIGGLRFRHRSV
jgi:hypothetical protein